MARTTTTAQDERLAAYDRETHVFVEVEDPDGNFQDVGDFSNEDFFDSLVIEASTDQPISRCTLTLWRAVGSKSLAPLMEGSPLNVDAGASYAPFLNPVREMRVKVATMLPGETVTAGDKVTIWEGLIDEIDWATERISIEARDPIARLNDRIIDTVATYGDAGGSKNIDDVMQDILDAEFGVSEIPLTVVGTPTLAIDEYELGNVSVLEALKALADLIGWNLHWKWDASASDFRLTFYEPDRTNTTASYSFGPDDYYDVTRAALGVEGIRNVGEVVYTDVYGDRQTVTDTRSTSVGIYGERFIRLDAQGTSIITSTQANNLLSAVLDDTEDPKVLQEIDTAFHWPLELGDVHTWEANGVHYDTNQTYACFSYRHELQADRVRTVIQAAGKPSGGFRRWLGRERSQDDTNVVPPSVAVSQNQSGTAGTVMLEITDPTDRVTATAFQPDAGGGDFDLSTDPTGWAVYDTTRPFTLSDTVTIASKHTSRIGWAVRWRDRNGHNVWTRGVVTFDLNVIAEITNITVDFNADGEAVVSATGDEDTANMYVTVGNGSAPSDPTAGTNNGSISGRNGTVDTGVKITTGNEAYVKVIGADSGGTLGPVQSARQARRIGPFHQDATSRSHTGDLVETTLETITIPADALGTNGAFRLDFLFNMTNPIASATMRVKLNGSTVSSQVFSAVASLTGSFMLILHANASTSAQRTISQWLRNDGVISSGSNDTTEDSTADMDITITLQLGNASDSGRVASSLGQLIGTV